MNEYEWKPGDKGKTVGGWDYFVVGLGASGKMILQVKETGSDRWQTIADMDLVDDNLRPMPPKVTKRQAMYVSSTGRLLIDPETAQSQMIMLDVTTVGGELVDVTLRHKYRATDET